jgi:hypothetical protein
MIRIPNGAAVRNKITGKLGRTFRPHSGRIRGCIVVQWDGKSSRDTVAIADVILVADSYDTAEAWETAKEAALVAAIATYVAAVMDVGTGASSGPLDREVPSRGSDKLSKEALISCQNN